MSIELSGSTGVAQIDDLLRGDERARAGAIKALEVLRIARRR